MRIGEAKSAQGLIDLVSNTLKQEGFESKSYDLAEAIETKRAMGLETKANEVVHTTNTGFGAELVPGAVQTTDFLDLVPTFSSFIGRLKGFHGRNLNKIQEVSVIGALPKHQLGTEWADNAGTVFAAGKGKLPTAKVTIIQRKYEFSVDVSDEEMRFVNVLDIVATIQKKLARSAAETQESLILNGDTVIAATGNINSDDEAPAATEHFLGANGLRKSAFTNAGTVDMGAMDFADFISLMAKLGKNANIKDCVWLFNQATLTKALGIAEFLQAYQNGKSSTVFSGALTNILGFDVLTAYDFPLTEADGKVSFDVPANNTKGGAMLLHTDAVQYGYSGDYNMEVFRVPGKGFQILGYYWMGMATNEKLAGQTDNMIALGINATV